MALHQRIIHHLDDDNELASTSHIYVQNGANTLIFDLDEGGNLAISGTLSQGSDQHRKEKILPINTSAILAKVNQLKLSEWQYKGETIRHVGPMAQDFYSAFGLGTGATSIASIDADGITLAAIQALYQELEIQTHEKNEMLEKIQQLEERLNTLEGK